MLHVIGILRNDQLQEFLLALTKIPPIMHCIDLFRVTFPKAPLYPSFCHDRKETSQKPQENLWITAEFTIKSFFLYVKGGIISKNRKYQKHRDKISENFKLKSAASVFEKLANPHSVSCACRTQCAAVDDILRWERKLCAMKTAES